MQWTCDPPDRNPTCQGKLINPIAVQAMGEDGIDISRALPRLMTTEQVTDSDVVITRGCGDVCSIFPGKRSPKGVGLQRPERHRCK